MSYKFKQHDDLGLIDEVGTSIGLLFDGVDLEKTIPGFTTLSVSGRGMLSRAVNLKSVSGMDGRIFSYSEMPERVLSVKYLLSAGSSAELRKAYSMLNFYLHKRVEKEIRFRDDLDYSFYGTLSGISESEETSNEIIGEIALVCSKPFKYSYARDVVAGFIPEDPYSIKVNADFKFTVAVGAEVLTFTNDLGDYIFLGPVIPAEYTLKFGDKLNIYENGIRKMRLLGITAGVEAFRIATGVTYQVSTGAAITGEYRVLRL